MSDWSEHVVGRLKQKQEDQRIKDQKFLEEQRTKRERGTPLWNVVRDAIRKRVLDLKETAGRDIVVIHNDQQFVMTVGTPDHRQVLNVAFDQSAGTLSPSTPRIISGDKWHVSVNDDGSASFKSGQGIPITPDAIAMQLLDALLEV
jgi:hypothetical protein